MRICLLAVALCGGCGSNAISSSSAAAFCIAYNACARMFNSVSSCASEVPVLNDSATAAAAQISPSEVNCIGSAGHDCTAARKCLANGSTPVACSGSGGSCMGSVTSNCTANAAGTNQSGLTLFDCSINAETCVLTGGSAQCGIGTCSMSGNTSCMGNILQRCEGGVLRNTDCAKSKAVCAVTNIGPLSIAHCRGSGAACTESDSSKGLRCDGNKVVYCYDGQEAEVDCGQYHLSCLPNANASGNFGCAQGSECDPGKFNETCTGTVFTFCNSGKIDTFDCTAHGYSACDAANRGGCTN